jgi:hypothetical protein
MSVMVVTRMTMWGAPAQRLRMPRQASQSAAGAVKDAAVTARKRSVVSTGLVAANPTNGHPHFTRVMSRRRPGTSIAPALCAFHDGPSQGPTGKMSE